MPSAVEPGTSSRPFVCLHFKPRERLMLSSPVTYQVSGRMFFFGPSIRRDLSSDAIPRLASCACEPWVRIPALTAIVASAAGSAARHRLSLM